MNVNELLNSVDNELSLEYLLNVLQGTLTIDDSITIVTTNYIDHLDPAFYRDGRFDVKLELKLCDHFQINSIYEKILGRKLDSGLLRRIPIDTYSPATIIYHVKDYIFNQDACDDDIMAKFVVN
jgi:SpoVK/Ycf46/Vps4 family AAA+-type ATPase